MKEENTSTKRVLIVEDDLLLSLVEERLIEKLGHEVVAKVGTGKEAIDKALNLNPDLILMDIILKGKMDGIQAMEKIRESSPVPVIFLSGNSDRFNYERAKKTDFIDYLVKPITEKDLVAPLQQAFNGESELPASDRNINQLNSGNSRYLPKKSA
ncbi:MAG: response regulator [Balneolaceae bacterium]|nr:response regulator [Balneolaceae bacterium]